MVNAGTVLLNMFAFVLAEGSNRLRALVCRVVCGGRGVFVVLPLCVVVHLLPAVLAVVDVVVIWGNVAGLI